VENRSLIEQKPAVHHCYQPAKNSAKKPAPEKNRWPRKIGGSMTANFQQKWPKSGRKFFPLKILLKSRNSLHNSSDFHIKIFCSFSRIYLKNCPCKRIFVKCRIFSKYAEFFS